MEEPLKPGLQPRARARALVISLIIPALALAIAPANAFDTDIFAASATGYPPPNVLIVIDNTSNWSRQDQHFPGGVSQGQAEVDAIKQVVQHLPDSINVGLMEFDTGGNSSADGGYIRFAISPMGRKQGLTAQLNIQNFATNSNSVLNTIYNNITSPNEKQNSGEPYGDLMYDVYNYFAGAQPYAPSNSTPNSVVVPGLPDPNGYVSNYTPFRSPLSSGTSCANNYIIFIGNPNSRGPVSDSAANTAALQALGGFTTELAMPQFSASNQSTNTNLGYSSACYTSAPSGTPTDYASQCPPASSTYGSCSYSTTDTTTTLPTCSAGTMRYSVVASGTSTVQIYNNQSVPGAPGNICQKTQPANPSCPAPTSTTSGNQTITTSWSGCTYTAGASCGNGGKVTWNPFGTETVTTTNNISSVLGNTFACYSSLSSCSTSDYSCPAGATCSCSSSGATTGGACPAGARYQALGTWTGTVESPTGTTIADTSQLNADEWSQFLHNTGVPVPPGQTTSYQTISTYAIDVYGAAPNATQSSLLDSMARAGGGKYFNATNEQAIISALESIFAEIIAANSDFASASLPISANNRAQNDNQVYIGVFRPDTTGLPRWFGNLKRYELAPLNGYTDLADVNGNAAVSATTGFITPCAVSWWTTDSGAYWYDTLYHQSRIFLTQATSPGTAWTTVGDDTNFAKGLCGGTSKWSDLPDGHVVEKGAAAEMLRQQTSRTVKTLSGSNTLVDFNTTNVTSLSSNSAVNANIVNFILGQDVTGEIAATPSTNPRPSIHGDVVHSRPLPIDYGGSTGVVVYYGANDGMFRAVNATSGSEMWSFVAPETFGGLQRLLDNSPTIQSPFPTPSGVIAPSGSPKTFFFDGSTGLYQNGDNSKVWIFPSMRRGGRMLYAFDVTTPGSPQFKWKAGCPDQMWNSTLYSGFWPAGDDNNCSAGMSGIGQTWSAPTVAFLPGYSTTTPVVIVGGGYDTCEDADSVTLACASPKGAAVYVLDASSGSLQKTFTTDRSVAAEVALVDINGDGVVDAAYVADTGGSLYRIDFSDPNSNFAALAPANWKITKVASTTGLYHKFLFAPAVVPYQGSVYVAIGSGDPEHPLSVSYPYTTPVTNRFYVYLDNPKRTSGGAINLDDTTGTLMYNYTSASTATCTTPGVLPGGSVMGWYMDLTAGTGEQTVTSSLIIDGMVTFSTNRPLASALSCSSSLGEARSYWVNLLNGSGAIGVTGTCGGSRSEAFVGGGIPPSPVSATVKINGVPETVVIGAGQRDGSNSSPLSGQQVSLPITTKRNRLYWRNSGDTH